MVEQWTLTKTKWEAFDELNEINVPCGPILDTAELLDDQDLRGQRHDRGGRPSRARTVQDRRLPVHAV